MNLSAQAAPIALKISDITIHQDSQGRFCLMNNCKKKYAMRIIDNMCQQRFIKITGDEVVYF